MSLWAEARIVVMAKNHPPKSRAMQNLKAILSSIKQEAMQRTRRNMQVILGQQNRQSGKETHWKCHLDKVEDVEVVVRDPTAWSSD